MGIAQFILKYQYFTLYLYYNQYSDFFCIYTLQNALIK